MVPATSFRFLRLAVLVFFIAQSLLMAFLMRPMQDDYFNLANVQNDGIFAHLGTIWNSHGGNMVQFFTHSIVILPSTNSFNFWSFGLFFLFSELLVYFTIRQLLRWVFPQMGHPNWMFFFIPVLCIIGFEGLFVPGFLGAFGFSLVTLAHIWPVLALIFGLLALRKFTGSWLLSFLLGLIAGNSNLAESVFACTLLILLLFTHLFFNGVVDRFGVAINSNFYFLATGTFLGTIGIAAAPGLWNRASNQVGLPDSISDFFSRFVFSFASFSADGLTHPMVWVLFISGILLSKAGVIPDLDLVSKFRVRLLIFATMVMWLSLVFGATFAYPAWHQSFGLLTLLMPASFCLGATLGEFFGQRNLGYALVLTSLLMSFVSIRGVVLGVTRSIAWDKNLASNVCLIESGQRVNLLGAEIRYPPFQLGVEDVNSWEWMRTKYIEWVIDIPSDKSCN